MSQGWEDVKRDLKERYLPVNFNSKRMNKFLACTRRGRTIDAYHEEFVRLSCHALDLTKEQNLSQFIQGLQGSLADEVEALRPTSIADALIRAKSKLKCFPGMRGWTQPLPHLNPTPIPRANPIPIASFVPHTYGRGRAARVNTISLEQDQAGPQCYKCGRWGHMKRECPMRARVADPTPNQRVALPP